MIVGKRGVDQMRLRGVARTMYTIDCKVMQQNCTVVSAFSFSLAENIFEFILFYFVTLH